MIGLLKKAIVDLPIRLNRTSKRISGNSLSPLEDRNKDFGEKGDLRGGSAHQEKFSNLGLKNVISSVKKTKENATVYISNVIGKVECLREKSWVKQ